MKEQENWSKEFKKGYEFALQQFTVLENGEVVSFASWIQAQARKEGYEDGQDDILSRLRPINKDAWSEICDELEAETNPQDNDKK